jgi:hypothetical protein
LKGLLRGLGKSEIEFFGTVAARSDHNEHVGLLPDIVKTI